MDPIKKRKLDENGVALPDSDAGPNQLTVDDARKIIEPFTHEQLLEIVKNAAVRHLDVLDAVRSIADRDPAQRKLFIRGLGWDTTTEKLRSLFSAYGDLDEGVVILDKATGKSKGYGFVTFKHVDGALLALKEPSKKIDGRMTVTQLAAAGIQPTVNPHSGVDVSARKIYVANVPHDMPGDRLLAHFLSYGEIEEGPLGFDKATGKSRGYALFVYKTVEAARASLVDPIKTIDGHQLNCKLAIDGKKGKPEMPVAAPGAGGVQGPTGVPGEAHGNGLGMHHPPSSMPGSLAAQYGVPVGSYGGFSGGLQGHHPLNSSMVGVPGLSSVGGAAAAGPVLSSMGNQAPSSLGASGAYGSGLGGPYGGSHYGGPGSTLYGGLGGATGGLGGSGGGFGGVGSGLGGAGRGSSLYGLPPSSGGMPSGSYPESAHYSLSSSGYSGQQSHPAGTSPATRVPPGGMYQSGPPYY
ncbi:hypothetical protein HYC85_014601 [Camellia sinensis]|uniref:RRM domain-containing protein n=1 Tax=Camellia sinensis TaxID=4442 RepID=A0A7J7H9W7_CAMSI|nr:hypothetical protein HYC85_014601 [Camellia sinensis]